MIIFEIVAGIAVFAVALFALTYTSAFVADITGTFRLLFIQKPYRQLFRLARWLLAGAVAIGIVAAIE
jgi:hypothetical protein